MKTRKFLCRFGFIRLVILGAIFFTAAGNIFAGTLSPTLQSVLPQLPDSADAGMVIIAFKTTDGLSAR
ncbi:hypothetical protein OFN94_40185, partial [Escherichia coli]|nr:hypothetical protein [Escherichia coli]